MSKARNLARLIVDSNGDLDVGNLGNVPEIPEVLTPTLSSPANGATGQGKYPALSSSGFNSLYGLTHSASQWQVATDSGFSNLVVDTGDVASLTSYTLTTGLSVSTTYYWRVRYKNSRGTYSAWSSGRSFVTNSSFTLAVQYFVVAGGGGGFGAQAISYAGAGGSGGGVAQVTTNTNISSGSLSVVVGAGGAQKTAGSSSSFNGTTANGGAGGGIVYNGTGGPSNPGVAGGLTQASMNSTYYSEGGYGAAGVWGPDGIYCPPQGIGGCCGSRNGTHGQPGLANRGGGGGSSGISDGGAPITNGGAGGSGVVVIRYAGAQQCTGGTVTSSGGYTYHTFTSSGTLVF